MADRVGNLTYQSLTSLDHELIRATTVCAIVEHGGELLMVRQLNREGQPRWNPAFWRFATEVGCHPEVVRVVGNLKFDAAKVAASARKPLDAITGVRLERLTEGLAGQILHVGPYAEEGPTIQRLHDFIAERMQRSREWHFGLVDEIAAAQLNAIEAELSCGDID